VTDDQTAVIRRCETEEDVFSRDVLPEHLASRKAEIVEIERLSV
jgi:hypothetical protein